MTGDDRSASPGATADFVGVRNQTCNACAHLCPGHNFRGALPDGTGDRKGLLELSLAARRSLRAEHIASLA
jgi:hypothetical protein